ncbi:hypothetical protein [Mesorhizobium sp. M8A.F.Ca.ET.198.01.1.1]|uniref:hypothetical protein n=1 Tax=Mesorhizobium sp. M8A.F.Ca.ET.198.01.1.1 TaxID=2563966 RepID=UPI00167B37C4|nr:hypothetical protein [Mesorhizobium sp. M8A.F.Ca.ET.198.01.1.1]
MGLMMPVANDDFSDLNDERRHFDLADACAGYSDQLELQAVSLLVFPNSVAVSTPISNGIEAARARIEQKIRMLEEHILGFATQGSVPP